MPGGGGQILGGILPETGVGSRAKNREIKKVGSRAKNREIKNGDVHCVFQKDDTCVQIRETSMRMSYSKRI